MILTLTVPGEPVPYMRVARDRHGRAYVPARMRAAQAEQVLAAWLLENARNDADSEV